MAKIFLPFIGSDRKGLGSPIECPNGLKDIIDFYRGYSGIVGISINRHPTFLSENDNIIYHFVLDKDETILGLCNFLGGRLNHTSWSELMIKERTRVINNISQELDIL